MAFICFVIATVLFFLNAISANWGPDDPVGWGFVFVALGLALSTSGPVWTWVRARGPQ